MANPVSSVYFLVTEATFKDGKGLDAVSQFHYTGYTSRDPSVYVRHVLFVHPRFLALLYLYTCSFYMPPIYVFRRLKEHNKRSYKGLTKGGG